MRDLLGWTKKEEPDRQSLSSVEVIDNDDLLSSINIEDLLNATECDSRQQTCVPPQMIKSVMTKNRDPMMSWGSCNKQKVFFEPRHQIMTDSGKPLKERFEQEGPFDEANELRQRTTKPQKKKVPDPMDNAPSVLGQFSMLMPMYTVIFMLILCVVQICSELAGLTLGPLPLLGLSSLLSVAVVRGKFSKKLKA